MTTAIVVGAAILDVLLLGAALRLRRRGRGLRVLFACEAATIARLSELMAPTRPDEGVPGDDVASNADHYLEHIDARQRRAVRLAVVWLYLMPLARTGRTFTRLTPRGRLRYYERRFGGDPGGRAVTGLGRRSLRRAMQLTRLAHYSDPLSYDATGYVPPSRARGVPLPRPGQSLFIEERSRQVDAVVVGSGAGGAMTARRLAEAGWSVLVLERGPYVAPMTYSEDEPDMLLRLYEDGALSLLRDGGLRRLSGGAVGGSTAVSHALLVEPPLDTMSDWGVGLDMDGIHASAERVKAQMGLGRWDRRQDSFDGLIKEAGARDATWEHCEASCGWCDIGCPYNEASVTTWLLPQAQQHFRLEVLPDCQVERIEMRGHRAVGVVAGGLRVRADTVVVAAGTPGSSLLLHRSGLGGRAVGHGLSFTLGATLLADFDEVLRAYLKQRVAFRPPDGSMLELWYGMQAIQALSLPGWVEHEAYNMRRYAHMLACTAFIGAAPAGVVRMRDGSVRYRVGSADVERLIGALRGAGGLLIDRGARRVMPVTQRYREYASPDVRRELGTDIRSADDLVLTGYAQGGNAIGAVVDADLRVLGTDNVYVCDASVFPTSPDVLPQLTVMALADNAARRLAGGLTA